MASNTASTHPSGPKRAAPSRILQARRRERADALFLRAKRVCTCATSPFVGGVRVARARVERSRTTCASTARPPARASRQPSPRPNPSLRTRLAHAAPARRRPRGARVPSRTPAKKIERARETAACSATSLQMSSFTAVCFSVSATAARSAGFSSAGSRASASVNADAAPAFTGEQRVAQRERPRRERRACWIPPRGPSPVSPVVSARAASHAALSAVASTRSRMTATMGTSAEALTNAPFSPRLAPRDRRARRGTRTPRARGRPFARPHAGGDGVDERAGQFEEGVRVARFVGGEDAREGVERGGEKKKRRFSFSAAASSSRARVRRRTRRGARLPGPRPRARRRPQPGDGVVAGDLGAEGHARGDRGGDVRSAASTAATKSRVAFAAGCSPRPSGPAYDL